MSCLLFVPSGDMRKFRKAEYLDCEGIVLDLEDAVLPAHKQAARDFAAQQLAAVEHSQGLETQTSSLPKIHVRINSLASDLWRADITAVVPFHPATVFVPKVESVDEMTMLDEALTAIESDAGIAEGMTKVHVMLESAKGLLAMESILGSSKRIVAASIGLADLALDVGVTPGLPMRMIAQLFMGERTRLAVVCRALGLPAPWDSVYLDIEDEEGFLGDAKHARNLGFAGKLVIHPKQVDWVNVLYQVTEEELAFAHQVLRTYTDASARGLAVATMDGGQFVDAPVLKQAERILARRSQQK